MRIVCAALCGFILLILCGNGFAYQFNFPPSDFDILSAGDGRLIGHGHYSLEESGGEITLRGENRYFTGEYDIEEDRLASGGTNRMPQLLSFRHDFFAANGAPTVVGKLDTRSGLGECGTLDAGTLAIKDQQFSVPEDTYAGASVLLPIQHLISRGDREPLQVHVFNCAPTPKLIVVDLKPEAHPITWADYPGELEKVDVKANFGFWTIVIAPFVPKLAAWFDPSSGMLLVGAQLERYYKGAKIILVRKREAEISKDRAADKAAR